MLAIPVHVRDSGGGCVGSPHEPAGGRPPHAPRHAPALPAAVDLHEEVPELLAPEHVDEEVGGRVEAGGDVGQGDGCFDELVRVASAAGGTRR